MIVSSRNTIIEEFRCKETKKVWLGRTSNKWSKEVQNKALRKLFMLHAANDIKDLIVPPSNRLHKLKGDKKENYSISVNKQWRITFMWENGRASEVQIIDCH